MKFIDRAIMTEKGRRDLFLRRTGTFEFSKSGLAASDITGKFNILASDIPEDAPEELKAMFSPERTIRVGTTSYLSGGLFSTMLPEDKTWLKMPKGPTGGLTGIYGQPVNLVEQATYKTLLKSGKPGKGAYTGSITFGELYKVSPWLRASIFDKPKAKALKSVLTWKLQLDGKGLPARLVTTFPVSALGMTGSKGTTLTVDTRYTGWGAKVDIKAPAADEVSSKLKDGTDELPDGIPLPDGSTVSQ